MSAKQKTERYVDELFKTNGIKTGSHENLKKYVGSTRNIRNLKSLANDKVNKMPLVTFINSKTSSSQLSESFSTPFREQAEIDIEKFNTICLKKHTSTKADKDRKQSVVRIADSPIVIGSSIDGSEDEGCDDTKGSKTQKNTRMKKTLMTSKGVSQQLD